MGLAYKLLAWLTTAAFAFAMLGASVNPARAGQTGASAQQPTQLPCRRSDSVEDAGSEVSDAVARAKGTSGTLGWDGGCELIEPIRWQERSWSGIAVQHRTVSARGPPTADPIFARA